MLYMGRLLLEGGININAQDDRGRTALHHAVLAGSEVMVRLLLEYKLDLSVVSNSLGTPVEVARANVSKGPEWATMFSLLKEAASGSSITNRDDLASAEAGIHGTI